MYFKIGYRNSKIEIMKEICLDTKILHLFDISF